ncbi:MAG TPA: enoyl-CoA hydratase/isomerase family protein [Chloroflexota bacterium]|jgi:thioesterase DpgC
MAIEVPDGVGFSTTDLDQFSQLDPRTSFGQSMQSDGLAASQFFRAGQGLLDRLPAKSDRSEMEQVAADAIHERLRDTRTAFLRRHAAEVYAALTDQRRRFVRIEELVYRAAELVPGLVPTRGQIDQERQHLQKDKEGYEIDQGLFLSYVLSDQLAGGHLVHAMLRPRQESLDLLPEFQAKGRLDVGTTTVERHGRVGYVLHGNPRFLNAEDDSTIPTLEIATDLVLLDPGIEAGVLRGKVVDHPRYAGRRVFNAGINLTHLYHGQISLVGFFVVRDIGYLNKMYRGLSGEEYWPNEVELSVEKPWIAAVEAFAIGGGCQLLLAMDHVLAERSSFFNLPARKEGIIPGVSNMRLWRFVGDRSARQAILFERQFDADSPAGQLICDRVVDDGQMDAALDETIAALLGAGAVSAAGNRKAIRIGQESIDQFRQYMAMYCREEAYCHYSPQLIANLEKNWNAAARRP